MLTRAVCTTTILCNTISSQSLFFDQGLASYLKQQIQWQTVRQTSLKALACRIQLPVIQSFDYNCLASKYDWSSSKIYCENNFTLTAQWSWPWASLELFIWTYTRYMSLQRPYRTMRPYLPFSVIVNATGAVQRCLTNQHVFDSIN